MTSMGLDIGLDKLGVAGILQSAKRSNKSLRSFRYACVG